MPRFILTILILASIFLVNPLVSRADDKTASCDMALPATLPTNRPPITSANADHLQQVGLIGRGNVRDFTWSPDGKILAVGTTIGIWLYDSQTFESPHLLKGHSDQINKIAFSPDGQLLASVSADKTIRLWSVATGQSTMVLHIASDNSFNLAFSPDGKLLASGAANGQVTVWSLATGKALRITGKGSGFNPASFYLAFTPDDTQLIYLSGFDVHLLNIVTNENRTLASLGAFGKLALSLDGSTLAFFDSRADASLQIWDVPTAKRRDNLRIVPGQVQRLVFSADNRVLYVGTSDGTTLALNLSDGTNKTMVDRQSGYFTENLSADLSTLLTISESSDIAQIFDVKSGIQRTVINFGLDHLMSYNAAIRPDGSLVAFIVDDNLHIWDTRTGKEQTVLTGYDIYNMPQIIFRNINLLVNSNIGILSYSVAAGERRTLVPKSRDQQATLSSDGSIAVTSQYDTPGMTFWNLETNDRATVVENSDPVPKISFSPDAKYVAITTDKDKNVVLRDTLRGENPELLRLMKPISETIYGNSFDFSSDSQSFAVADAQNRLSIYDILSGKITASLPDVQEVKYSSSNNLLFVYGPQSGARLWNPSTGQQIKLMAGGDAVFSPDDKTLLVNNSQTLSIYDAGSGHRRAFMPPNKGIRPVFSPDSSLFTYSPDPSTVTLNDTITGQKHTVLLSCSQSDLVESIAFDVDGSLLAVASAHDDVVRLWSIS